MGSSMKEAPIRFQEIRVIRVITSFYSTTLTILKLLRPRTQAHKMRRTASTSSSSAASVTPPVFPDPDRARLYDPGYIPTADVLMRLESEWA